MKIAINEKSKISFKHKTKINDYNSTLTNLYKAVRKPNSGENTLDYKVKLTGDNKGQFGYYVTEDVASIIGIMKAVKAKSILDLGSGPGLILKTIRTFTKFEVSGYDNERELVEIGNHILGYDTLKLKDILTVTTQDIGKFDVLYFWEPLRDRELCEKFVDNLSKVTVKDQYIIYKPAGSIAEYLHKVERFEKVELYGQDNHMSYMRVYKVTK